ncbi:DEAD/DEAH box helicase family protein, partial [Frankia sp. AvcI1]
MRAGPLDRRPRPPGSGAPSRPLRAWQRAALDVYRSRSSSGARDFLAVATPGAGKTTFALQVATDLLGTGEISRITVVAPTEHLKRQWAVA